MRGRSGFAAGGGVDELDRQVGARVTRRKTFKSDAFASVHTSAQALYRAGVINKATLRDFDEQCLSVTSAFAPVDIQRLREANRVSQPRALSQHCPRMHTETHG